MSASRSKRAAFNSKAPPVVLDPSGDAAVLDLLVKHETPPTLFTNLAAGLKAIWVLKSLAARARVRVRESKAAGHAKKKRPRKTKPEAGPKLLRNRLSFLGLRMNVIEGDGNCQFRAASHCLFGTQEHHAMVRAAAVEYMRAHAADFSFYVAEEGMFEDYLRVMLKGRRGKVAWGDELTLRAICNTFGVRCARCDLRDTAPCCCVVYLL